MFVVFRKTYDNIKLLCGKEDRKARGVKESPRGKGIMNEMGKLEEAARSHPEIAPDNNASNDKESNGKESKEDMIIVLPPYYKPPEVKKPGEECKA